MAYRSTIKNYIRETYLFNQRVLISFYIVLFLAALLIGRLIYLQIGEYDVYATLSNKNQFNLIPLEPNRGLVYDRNGILLAENIPVFSLDIIPDHVKNLKNTINQLGKIVSLSPEDIRQFYKSLKQYRRFEPVPLKYKLNDDEVAHFYVNLYQFPGVTITARLLRHYPLGPDVAEVLGFVGRINLQELNSIDQTTYSASNYIGKVGIEKYYETQLHGQVGYQQVEMDASGRIVRTVKRIPPTPGTILYLTIDSQLQKITKEAFGNENGAAVAIQPDTGQVLAMVSHPSYDPNLFVKGITQEEYKELHDSPNQPLYNRSIRGQYPLASTIKPFIALLGLDTNTIDPEFSIWDTGVFQLPNSSHIYHDWQKGHGRVDIHTAIMVSCDIYFFQLAVKLGIKNIDNILSRFGFGEPTNVDTWKELPGVVSSPEWKKHVLGQHWYPGDTVISGIGQGFMLTTPVQLASAIATLAERGLRYQPSLVLKEKLPNGKERDHDPTILTPIILHDKENWNIVISAMQEVVNNARGTAGQFGRDPPYTIAAKTGTAQTPRPAQYKDTKDQLRPKEYRNHHLFIAFAPVENPKIAVAVVSEHANIAAAIARKMIDFYLKVPPKKISVVDTNNSEDDTGDET